MNELALFAGAGGGILGGHLLGWRTVCAVEWEAYPASVLVARQNDKILPTFPIWDDVQTFDGKPWKGIVDVVSEGFPCQDISAAGNGVGITGKRSSMWGHMARIIGEVRPKYAFIENSPMLTTRGLERVLADLAKMGFNAEWGVLSAADVGANHKRDRIWIVAKQRNIFSHSMHDRIGWREQRSESIEETTSGNFIRQLADTDLCRRIHGQTEIDSTIGEFDAFGEFKSSSKNVADTTKQRCQKCGCTSSNKIYSSNVGGCSCYFGQSSNWWASEPNVGRVADGVAARVDRLKAIGNGQVPLCAATAWNILKGRINDKS